MVGGLLYLSFLSYFFKLVYYAHVFPCIKDYGSTLYIAFNFTCVKKGYLILVWLARPFLVPNVWDRR